MLTSFFSSVSCVVEIYSNPWCLVDRCILILGVILTVLLVKAQLWQLAQRTTALPFGRGAFTLATIFTLLTEVLPFFIFVHKLLH